MHLWPFSLYCGRKAGKESMGKDIQQMAQGRFDPRPVQLPNTIWVICLVQTYCEIQGLKRKFKKGKKEKRIQLQIWHKDHFWRKYHIVCHCQSPLIFSSGFLSKRCHSVSAIANQSENTLLQEQSLQQENQLYEFLHNIQQAKADDSTWAPGDTR